MALTLKDSVGYATKERDEKQGVKAKHTEAAAEAKGTLSAATLAKNADVKYLGDLNTLCDAKKMAFDNRQQLRAEEMEAIQQAIEIISSSSVSGKADKHLPSLLQGGRKTSLAQFLGSSSSGREQQRA